MMLRPRSHWVSSQLSPDPLAAFKEPTSKGRKGKATEGKEKRRNGGACENSESDAV